MPVTAYRGAGRPDAAYIVERLVDEAARQTGIDRLRLRRRNFIPRDAFPYKLATLPVPMAYDSGDFHALLDAAVIEANWDGFEKRRREAAKRGRLRGIGCAVFIEPAGGAALSDEAMLTFEPDGGILLHTVAIASGQGHETVFPEIVGRALQIDPACIRVCVGSPAGQGLKGGSSVGSRTTMSVGPVGVEAAMLVIKKGRVLASGHLEAAEGDIEYANGSFRVAGTDRAVGLSEIARRSPGALDSKAELPAPIAFPSGAHIAEVEIDPDTGVMEIVSYVSVDDCGAVINETLLQGQLWGGIVQGLGQVVGEICKYDAEGQLVSGSFMDYYMPRANLLRNLTAKLVMVASPTNQLGVKGIGEAGTIGALPTAMNAILDALRPRGVMHLDMPASAFRIWEALNMQSQSKSSDR